MYLFSKIRGTFLGVALGDGLGEYPSLLRSTEKIPPTDDTLMTLALAEVLFQNGKYNPQKVAEKYLQLYEEGILTKIGFTTYRALERFKKTKNWFYSGVADERAAGNGVAMRIAPIGVYAYLKNLTLEDFYETVRWEGYITHRNELAISGAFAVAYAVYLNLKGGLNKTEVVKEVTNTFKRLGIENPVKGSIENSLKLLEETSQRALTIFGTSGYVVHTVGSAFYLFLKMEDFLKGIEELLKVGGDTDTIGAIFGALYGSFYGEEKLPSRYVERLKVLPDIGRLVEMLQKG